MLTFWVFIHLVGVLGFLAAHGTSTAVALRLRRQRDREQVRALLDLSRSMRPVNFVSLLLLLVGGVAAAIEAHLWTQMWLDLSLGLFIALAAIGVPILVRHFVREFASRMNKRIDGIAEDVMDLLLRHLSGAELAAGPPGGPRKRYEAGLRGRQ